MSAVDAIRRKIESVDDIDIVSLFDNPYNLDGSTFETDDFTRRIIFAESHNRDLERLLPELHYCLGNLRKDAATEIDRLSPTSNRGDIWRQTFVEGIGYSWRLMTGNNPARGGPFQDFTEAAYRSIGGSDSVERQIRTVLDNMAKRPEHDRFDRDSLSQDAEEDGYVPVTEQGLAQGEIIEVTGRVLNLDGEPVRSIPITVWQANTFGRYAHGNDRNPAPLDSNFVGCVVIRSDDDGFYRIKTVKPGAYPAGPDWMRPPHIHFEVHGRFERLITQMYFPDEPLNAYDRLLNAALRPDLLIAKPVPSEDGSGLRILNFDIVLARG